MKPKTKALSLMLGTVGFVLLGYAGFFFGLLYLGYLLISKIT